MKKKIEVVEEEKVDTQPSIEDIEMRVKQGFLSRVVADKLLEELGK